jgi:hypothetical protein
LPFFFNFIIGYTIKIKEKHNGFKLNGTYRLLVYFYNFILFEGNLLTGKQNHGFVLDISEEVSLKVNREISK